jgi:GntR family transcriptional regulator
MASWFHIDHHSGIPIYLQLVEQIKHALEIGVFRPGDALPTVRELSKLLIIAPNTIVKAYGELESLGLIESRAGAGTLVSPILPEILHSQAQENIHIRLIQLLQDAVIVGISMEDLTNWFNSELQEIFAAHTKTLSGEKELYQNES